MARTRRRAPIRRKSVKADWVYRPNVRGTVAMPGADSLGTYEASVRGLAAGNGNAQALVLYESHNRTRSMLTTPTGYNPPTNAARAEGQRAMVLACEGGLYVEPSTWAVGNILSLGMRFMICEQDGPTGLASLDVDYGMWSNSVQTQPADWANNRRMNLKEKRFFQGFDTNDTLWYVPFRWRGRYRLEPNEAFFLWLESETTGVNIRYQTWFRSLVSDEG